MQKIIPLSILIGFLTLMASPVLAQTNPGPAGVKQLQELIQRIIAISVGLAFIALTVMLVWGGIQYLISAGEKTQVQKAQQTITWAILGIIFMVIAWLVLLLIQSFTGVRVTEFCIGLPGAPTKCT